MALRQATIRFYADLAELAGDVDRGGEARVTVEVRRSVKDAIESCGVPHTEVGLVLVNGDSVGFEHVIGDGDRVVVYPPFATFSIDAVSRVRPPPLPETRFVLDVHLGRLTQRLRLLGFDAVYRNDFADHELAAVAAEQGRWLLTRDRGLLMRAEVTHGCLLRSTDPRAQTVEVLGRLRLADELAPFSRCVRCNGRLQPVAKSEIVHLLEPGTRAYSQRFARCRDCGRLYWDGSHQPALQAFVAEVAASPSRGRR